MPSEAVSSATWFWIPDQGAVNTYAAPCEVLEPTRRLGAPATTVLPDTATDVPSWSLSAEGSLASSSAVWVWVPDQGPVNTYAAPWSCSLAPAQAGAPTTIVLLEIPTAKPNWSSPLAVVESGLAVSTASASVCGPDQPPPGSLNTYARPVEEFD